MVARTWRNGPEREEDFVERRCSASETIKTNRLTMSGYHLGFISLFQNRFITESFIISAAAHQLPKWIRCGSEDVAVVKLLAWQLQW